MSEQNKKRPSCRDALDCFYGIGAKMPSEISEWDAVLLCCPLIPRKYLDGAVPAHRPVLGF